MNVYIPGIGPNKPKIAIVGEAPSFEEERALKPFVGASGRFLDALLDLAGIDRNGCWVTNVCKYMVPANSKEGRKIPFKVRAESVGIDFNQQIEELRVELQNVQPNLILALGATAFNAITNKHPLTSWRGSIVMGMGFKTIGTYHPAHILHQDQEVKGYWNKEVMLFDLRRAKIQSEFKEIRLPFRNLQICKSSYQLEEFLKKYKDYKHPSIDIEALMCIPACIGISFHKSEGLCVPLWNKYDISEMSDNEIVRCWNLMSESFAKHEVVGQNFGYDRDKLKRLGFVFKGLHSDTMYKSFAINPELPKGLAFNTSIFTEEPFYKDEEMYEGEVKDLLIGCARDACVTKEVDDAMQEDLNEMNLDKYYRNFLLKLHDLYAFDENDRAIEQHGFKVDENIRRELINKYIEWDEKIRYELFKITGEYINCSSPKQVADLLYEKWKLPIRKGTGEEVLIGLLNNTVKNPVHIRGIELILEDRRVKKTLSSYLYSPTDFDGRMRASFFLCLETGRSSTQQQEPPIRPEVTYKAIEEGKKVNKKTARGMAFQTITKHGDVGQDIRKFLIPDEGTIFLQADLSQAEARVIFKLADDEEALEAIDKHDYHALTATWFFGGVESDYSKKVLGYESPIRFAGKTLRHACHLGASKKRAAITVNTEARKNKIDFRISEAKADYAIKVFHNKQPKIRGNFHAGIQRALEKDRRLIAPVPFGIDAEVGGIRTFFERWGDELFRQAYSYIPQRTVSEHTKAAAIRIRKRAPWIGILVEAHDALLCQVPIGRKYEAALIIREEFERPINFDNCTLGSGNLVIPADVEIGTNYKDLGKFNWKEAELEHKLLHQI